MGLYHFRFLEQLKISSCVANTFHLPEQIEKLFAAQPYYKGKVSISEEGQNRQILGSAGGLKRAAKLFSDEDNVLMLNADEVFFTKDNLFLQKAYAQHIKNNNFATLVVTNHAEAGKKFGAIWANKKKVKDIGKKIDRPNLDPALKPYHYVGMIFLNKKIMSLIPENQESNIFYDILINQLNNSSVEVYNLDCRWFETGNAVDYFAATKTMLESLDDETLKFINGYDPSRVVKNAEGVSLISNSVSLDEKKLFGFNAISKSANIKNLKDRVDNSILFENESLNTEYFL